MQVRVRDLTHSFDGTHSMFFGLSTDFDPGDLVALTGPSGPGKSTLLSILARWVQPSRGTVEWDGIDSVGWVFQNPYGVARRAVLDHVSLPLIAQGASRTQADRRALETLARFGLQDVAPQPFSTLSGGEAQRLMLARAVAKAPSLLLVDEPTAQLDPESAATVNHVLGQLAMNNSIVVVATHDPDTQDACARRIDVGGRHSTHQGPS